MNRAGADAIRIQHGAIVAGVVAVGVVVVGTSLIAMAMRLALYRPLRALRDAISSFSSGQTSARAEEEVPTELREIARTFNQMASAILRQRKDELASLAGVAHDLNNPIAVLCALTEPSMIERATKSHESVGRTLGLVHRQAQRMQRMVGDLLDTALIESGQVHFELADHDLREVARGPVELCREMSEAHKLSLSAPDEPVMARCDAGRLEQALFNLIGNAIKFSPNGGPVIVTVASDEHGATLSVSDRGIGMTEEQSANIFEPFRRAGPPGIAGAGLGLSLVRRIVEAHGGEVDVESVAGAGSTFRIRLPSTQKAERRPSLRHLESRDSAGSA